jgi:hypothetical protein
MFVQSLHLHRWSSPISAAGASRPSDALTQAFVKALSAHWPNAQADLGDYGGTLDIIATRVLANVAAAICEHTIAVLERQQRKAAAARLRCGGDHAAEGIT